MGRYLETLPAVPPVAIAATLAPPSPPHIRGGGTVWRAAGGADACGTPWAIALAVAGGRASGTLVRGGASYDLQGALDPSGRMADGAAGKSLASSATRGPRLIRVQAAFAEEAAEGAFWIERGCETRFTLLRAER